MYDSAHKVQNESQDKIAFVVSVFFLKQGIILFLYLDWRRDDDVNCEYSRAYSVDIPAVLPFNFRNKRMVTFSPKKISFDWQENKVRIVNRN